MPHMVRLRLAFLAAGLAASLVLFGYRGSFQAWAWGSEAGTRPGQPAPELPATARTLDGSRLRLSDLRGRAVILHFWTFACSNCKHMLPKYAEWSRRPGVAVVGVHTPELEFEHDEKRLCDFVAAQKISWPVITDRDYAIWDLYGIHAWPTIILIDRTGTVRATFVGDDSARAIDAALAAL